MHKIGRELFPYDPKIDKKLWKARKGGVTIENHMERGMEGLHQNVGEAIEKKRINRKC